MPEPSESNDYDTNTTTDIVRLGENHYYNKEGQDVYYENCATDGNTLNQIKIDKRIFGSKFNVMLIPELGHDDKLNLVISQPEDLMNLLIGKREN